jgi:uncharacterized protein (TIGR02594 family)
MQNAPWLSAAWAEFGVREKPGPANEPRVVRFFAEAGHGHVKSDATAWCAAFVAAILARSGIQGSGSLLARSYLNWGTPLAQPRPGAIAVLSRGPARWTGHVAFYLGEAGERVFLLGGNQSNAVTVAAFDRKRVLGYRWPASAPQWETARSSGDGRLSAAQDEFRLALAHVLRMEGGYSNDPHDPGGPTNRGITLAVFAKWRGETLDATSRQRLLAELKRISDDEVAAIYEARYWRPACCASLPPGLDLMHFDAAVNHGVGGAARMLQQALEVTVDGVIGPNTRAAARRRPLRVTLDAYGAIRRARYRTLKTFWRFGRGWLRRVDATLEAAAARGGGVQAQSPAKQGTSAKPAVNSTPTTQKGRTMSEQIGNHGDGKWWGHSKTVWGTIITALSTVLPVVGPLIGVDLPVDVVRQIGEQTVLAIQVVGGLAGLLLTLYGRVRASEPITRRNVSLRL